MRSDSAPNTDRLRDESLAKRQVQLRVRKRWHVQQDDVLPGGRVDKLKVVHSSRHVHRCVVG
jgi:hypothetical protein